MKVVILCGGKGTRFREETEFKPKPLALIGDKPILWHIMKTYAHYGFKEFILCLGYRGDMIKDYFLRYRELASDFTLRLRSNHDHLVTHHHPHNIEDWDVTFADTGAETQTAGRVLRVRKYIGEDEDFFLTYGDGVAKINIQHVYQFHKDKGRVLTLVATKIPTTYGVIEDQDGVVTSFSEKPVLEKRINGGFYVCSRKFFDYISGDESVLELDPIRKLVQDGELAAYPHDDFWHGINNYRDWEMINKMEMSGNTPWKVWNEI